MLRLLIIVKGLCVHTVVVVSWQACFFLFLYLTSLGNIIRLGRVIKCATSILIVYLVRFNDAQQHIVSEYVSRPQCADEKSNESVEDMDRTFAGR